MADNIYGGSHEVKECFADGVYQLFDRVMIDIEAEKIPRDVGFHVLKAATESPDVAFRVIDQYSTKGSLDVGSLNL